jgi:hypothetical protein
MFGGEGGGCTLVSTHAQVVHEAVGPMGACTLYNQGHRCPLEITQTVHRTLRAVNEPWDSCLGQVQPSSVTPQLTVSWHTSKTAL